MGINETQCKSHWHRIGRYDREIKLIRSVWADEDVSLFALFVTIFDALCLLYVSIERETLISPFYVLPLTSSLLFAD